MSRLYVFGGSIAAGFPNNTPYGQLVADRLNCDYDNYAQAMSIITASLVRIRSIQFSSSDLVLIQHGLAEGLWRVKQEHVRVLPEKYHGYGGLDPSPFKRSSIRRRLMQVITTSLRALFRWSMLIRGHCERLLDPEEYERNLTALLQALTVDSEARPEIVIVGPVPMHQFYFPLGNRSLRQYWAITQSVANNFGVRTIDLWEKIPPTKRHSDKFHPNGEGHLLIANIVERALL